MNLAAGMVFGTALGGAAFFTVLWGPLWGLGVLGIGFSTVGWMAEAFGLFGNDQLEKGLRARLRVTGPEWAFVGLCRAEQNRLGAKLFPPRVETDENVGFLRVGADRLDIELEGQRRQIDRGALRDVRLEPVAEAPALEWIRLELYDDEASLQALLLMARSGETLREQRAANRALFERLRSWHVEYRLAPLVAAGELPTGLLGSGTDRP